ncbi:hypothetical protein [Klebsiella michiganensis]|uniref:hypothetical protein n=1 Tax=Klebsiella michiganensis TaxID=1134687 RepID=UPI001F4FB34F|nr:hypothetical protein [Klebsiella michiganensis]
MTTDITELAQSKALHKKLNRRLNDALGFQRTSGGKHTTISLSIDECKSVLSDLDERFALVEALEKAQAQSSKWLEAYHKAVSIGARYEERIAELESRTVTVKLPQAVSAGGQGYQAQVERILTAAGIKWEAE